MKYFLILIIHLAFAQHAFSQNSSDQTIDSPALQSSSGLGNSLVQGAEELNASFLKINGDLEVGFKGYQLPSSQKGIAEFVVNFFKLNLEYSGVEDIVVSGETDLFNDQHNTIFMQKNFSQSTLKVGLISHLLQEFKDDFWDFHSSFESSQDILIKNDYQSWSDYGVSYFYDDRSHFNLSLALLNGEFNEQKESGPNKELQLLIDWRPFKSIGGSWSHFFVMLHYSKGAYENIDPELNTKERSVIGLGCDNGGDGKFYIEASQMKDAVDGVLPSLAEEVDLTSFGGQIVTAKAFSVMFAESFNFFGWTDQDYGIWLRHDLLVPNDKVSNGKQNIVYYEGGIRQNLSPNHVINFSYQVNQYGDDHSLTMQNKESWLIATQYQF